MQTTKYKISQRNSIVFYVELRFSKLVLEGVLAGNQYGVGLYHAILGHTKTWRAREGVGEREGLNSSPRRCQGKEREGEEEGKGREGKREKAQIDLLMIIEGERERRKERGREEGSRKVTWLAKDDDGENLLSRRQTGMMTRLWHRREWGELRIPRTKLCESRKLSILLCPKSNP